MSVLVKRLCTCVLIVAMLFLSAARAICGEAAPKTPAFTPGSWSLVLLPDTQHYSQEYPGVFSLQTHWIVKNKDKFNVRYVLHLGDVTNANTEREWRRAGKAMSDLDGNVPYAVVLGNHDYFPDAAHSGDLFSNKYFPPSKFQKWPTFGGLMREGDVKNSYHLFSAGGVEWIILALEVAPRNETVQWANEVLAKHPQQKAILVTHAYLYDSKTRDVFVVDRCISDKASSNNGEQLWQKLVRKNNFALTFNGHVSAVGTGFLSSKNDRGKLVHQMLSDYQRYNLDKHGNAVAPYCPKQYPKHNLGGGGYLRILEFLPDRKTVQVKSYSPLFDKYLTNPANQFDFELDQ